MEGTRFGEVHGYDGVPLPAPQLPPLPLKPRDRGALTCGCFPGAGIRESWLAPLGRSGPGGRATSRDERLGPECEVQVLASVARSDQTLADSIDEQSDVRMMSARWAGPCPTVFACRCSSAGEGSLPWLSPKLAKARSREACGTVSVACRKLFYLRSHPGDAACSFGGAEFGPGDQKLRRTNDGGIAVCLDAWSACMPIGERMVAGHIEETSLWLDGDVDVRAFICGFGAISCGLRREVVHRMALTCNDAAITASDLQR